MSDDVGDKAVQDAVKLLSEHWDNVQVFVSKVEEGGTGHHIMGKGNWFARYGLVHQWLTKVEETWRVETWRVESRNHV